MVCLINSCLLLKERKREREREKEREKARERENEWKSERKRRGPAFCEKKKRIKVVTTEHSVAFYR